MGLQKRFRHEDRVLARLEVWQRAPWWPRSSRKRWLQRAICRLHHIREVSPSQLAPAEMYAFSSPARFGKPIRGMRRFLEALRLPASTRYADFTTEASPKLSKKIGTIPTEEELFRWDNGSDRS
jgi:hypothetical protein